MLRTLTTAVITIASTAASMGDDATSLDKHHLQGEWRLVEREHKGKRTKDGDAGFRPLRLYVEGEGMVMALARRKTFTIDASKSPKTMDITSHDGNENGQTAACI